MGTMGIFSAALGMSCEDCHAAGDANWSVYATDNPRKQMARVMVTMMATINKTHFRGRQVVTCYTCHRGSARPRATAESGRALWHAAVRRSNAVIEQAAMRRRPTRFSTSTSRRLAERSARGVEELCREGDERGYGPENEPRPLEIYSRERAAHDDRPARRRVTAPRPTMAAPAGSRRRSGRSRARVSPQEVDGLKLEADLALPRVSRRRSQLAGRPGDSDRRSRSAGRAGHDRARWNRHACTSIAETGLLVRHVRYNDSPVGRISRQTDYSDYREVAGVRMPFKWTDTWLDGRDVVELTDVQPNVAIDAARFARPAAPVSPPAK